MARAKITTKSGLVMHVDGTPAEISAVLQDLKRQEAAPKRKSGRPGPALLGDLIGALIDGGFFKKPQDLAAYCASYLLPPSSLISAVELALVEHAPGPPPMGLGWFHQRRAQFHEGGTAGFQSYVAIHRPTATGVVLLANSCDAADLRNIGARVLTEMVNSRL